MFVPCHGRVKVCKKQKHQYFIISFLCSDKSMMNQRRIFLPIYIIIIGLDNETNQNTVLQL